MKIKGITAVLLIIAVSFSMLALVSCNNGEGGVTTPDPNLIKVQVRFNDPNGDPFLLDRELEVPIGATVEDAAIALLEARNATYKTDISGMYENITYEGTTIQGSSKNLANGNVQTTYMTWSLNGERVDTLPSSKAVAAGDQILFYFVTEEITPDTGSAR